ncbi:hypothetical protein VNO77_06769 [Canavalia gladiata]|uniref:Uncharacterized protein n=1 Tax=Canavalia gladiata TaxID=3824 RepID=A0AAN9MDL5_CANGL
MDCFCDVLVCSTYMPSYFGPVLLCSYGNVVVIVVSPMYVHIFNNVHVAPRRANNKDVGMNPFGALLQRKANMTERANLFG